MSHLPLKARSVTSELHLLCCTDPASRLAKVLRCHGEAEQKLFGRPLHKTFRLAVQ
jgi:hypothetical protein